MDIFKELVDNGVLTDEQVKTLTESIDKKILEKASMKAEVLVESRLKEQKEAFEKEANEFLDSEYKKANMVITERDESIASKDKEIEVLNEKLNLQETQLQESIAELESKSVKKLDLYLEDIGQKQISDELVEKTAKLELYESLFNGIKGLMLESIVELDEDTAKAISESKESSAKVIAEKDSEIKVLKENLEEQSKLSIAKSQENENLQRGLILLKESDGLTDEEFSKMENYFAGKTLSETKEYIGDFKKLLEENSVNNIRTSFKDEKVSSENKETSTTSTEVQLDESRSIEEVERQIESSAKKGKGNKQFNYVESLLD